MISFVVMKHLSLTFLTLGAYDVIFQTIIISYFVQFHKKNKMTKLDENILKKSSEISKYARNSQNWIFTV
jgi:hypothetical protein